MINIYDDFFSKKDCEEIIKYGKSFNQDLVMLHKNKNNLVSNHFEKIENIFKLKIDKSNFISYSLGVGLGRHRDLSGPFTKRKLSAIIYLNDVFVGGETRIYIDSDPIDITPKQGKMISYDSSLEHEGLPPKSNKKYIMTAWLI